MDYSINELCQKGFRVRHFQIMHKHAMGAPPLPWMFILSASLYGRIWNFWTVKRQRVLIFIVICPITYSCILNGDFNHGMGCGKFMCMFKWEGIVRVLIWYLAMCGGFYMGERLCSCLFLSSLRRSWWGVTNFFAVIEVSNIIERGVPKYGL